MASLDEHTHATGLALPDGFNPIKPVYLWAADRIVITSNGDIRFGKQILEELGELPVKVIPVDGEPDIQMTRVVVSSNYKDGLVFQFFGETDSFLRNLDGRIQASYSYSGVKTGINGYSTLMNCGIDDVLQLLDPENNGGEEYTWVEENGTETKTKREWLYTADSTNQSYLTSISFGDAIVDGENKTIQVSTENIEHHFKKHTELIKSLNDDVE